MKEQSLTQLHTEPFAAEREWTAEGIPVLTASVSLPEPTGKDAVSRRIRRFYRLQSRSYLRYCERWLFPQAAMECREALAASRPLPQFRAELSYRVTCNEGGLWSLYTQSREAGLPGQSPLLTRRGDTWDLAAGYPVPLGDFFPRTRGWKKQLLSAAEAEILRQESTGVSRYHEGWRRALRQRFNAQNYYLTEDGLVFFYPMYALAPAVEGIPVFTIPFADFPKNIS